MTVEYFVSEKSWMEFPNFYYFFASSVNPMKQRALAVCIPGRFYHRESPSNFSSRRFLLVKLPPAILSSVFYSPNILKEYFPVKVFMTINQYFLVVKQLLLEIRNENWPIRPFKLVWVLLMFIRECTGNSYQENRRFQIPC